MKLKLPSNYLIKSFFKKLFGIGSKGKLRTEGRHFSPDSQEGIIRKKVSQLGGKRVESVMIPRTAIKALDSNDSLESLEELLQLFTSYSRLPVYHGDLDNITKVLHLKDVLSYLGKAWAGENTKVSIEEIFSSDLGFYPIIVPAAKPVMDVLLEMRKKKKHMAMVVDEYGGTSGLVTMEDLLEEIVGDIADEHDLPETLVTSNNGLIEIDARMDIEDFEEKFRLPSKLLSSEDEDVKTMGGLATSILGHFPEKNELIKHPSGLCLEASRVTPKTILSLVVRAFPSAKNANRMKAAKAVATRTIGTSSVHTKSPEPKKDTP